MNAFGRAEGPRRPGRRGRTDPALRTADRFLRRLPRRPPAASPVFAYAPPRCGTPEEPAARRRTRLREQDE
ncbi:hypothetical protein GCM10010116_15190 [Microbispora rosea subsp. aerata]|nr:hypothetical protein GCM10010116_15190 [Microbispora rosea subsp. aerata]GIH53219.1 hypothetical protein Mro02_01330 [Microbispora rosea subsp. aerata]GLJ83869.1 hypothetical protein GCM10017588_25970 [Microbispora rosea subsp. aerata]